MKLFLLVGDVDDLAVVVWLSRSSFTSEIKVVEVHKG